MNACWGNAYSIEKYRKQHKKSFIFNQLRLVIVVHAKIKSRHYFAGLTMTYHNRLNVKEFMKLFTMVAYAIILTINYPRSVI
jgi:hypothetical protein